MQSMVEQPRNQVSDMHFDKCPDPSTFQCWKRRFKTEVWASSNFPTEGVLWITEVEMVESVDLRRRDQLEHRFPSFEMRDAKIASALKKIIRNPNFKKKVSLKDQEGPNGRPISPVQTQIAYVIHEYFRVTGAHEAVLDYTDLFSTTLHGDFFKILIPDGIRNEKSIKIDQGRGIRS